MPDLQLGLYAAIVMVLVVGLLALALTFRALDD